MMGQPPASDPYETVIADLRNKRDQIDQTIALLTALRGGPPNIPVAPSSPAPVAADETGPFFGMSIVDGTKKLLEREMRPLGNADIAYELQAGGIVLSSEQPLNVVGSVLTRRFQQVGDVVKVGRGVWGLKDWYPEQSFSSTSKTKTYPVYNLQINDLSSTGAEADDDL